MQEAGGRQYWVSTLNRIASPVLSALEQGTLHASLPGFGRQENAKFAPLEAFGRLYCGIAPWLGAQGIDAEEEALRQKCLDGVARCVTMAVDPESPDYMGFGELGNQTLVDAAFLAQGLLRSPRALLDGLSARTRDMLIVALRSTRKIIPGNNNWLLFSAMVEAGLYCLEDESYDLVRIVNAVRLMMSYYKGDGIYGDGAMLHCDYYNSYVIHPMLVDILSVLSGKHRSLEACQPVVRERASRCATVLEHMIAPDGTFPVLGRSMCYRFGAFHLLAQMAYLHGLEDAVSPAGVRCGLEAAIRRCMAGNAMLDEKGWLRPGIAGYQPGLAESYINTGSLYLCATAFLPLGLPPQDAFWHDPDQDWTGKKIWKGEDYAADHHMNDAGAFQTML